MNQISLVEQFHDLMIKKLNLYLTLKAFTGIKSVRGYSKLEKLLVVWLAMIGTPTKLICGLLGVSNDYKVLEILYRVDDRFLLENFTINKDNILICGICGEAIEDALHFQKHLEG